MIIYCSKKSKIIRAIRRFQRKRAGVSWVCLIEGYASDSDFQSMGPWGAATLSLETMKVECPTIPRGQGMVDKD